MGLLTKFSTALVVSSALCSPAWSADARSLALGGSAIANGKGVHGAMENPASMMAMQRDGYRTHFRLGASAQFRDANNAIDVVSDNANQNLLSDIEAQIDELGNRQILCDPVSGAGEDICLSDTQDISDTASRLLSVINSIDDENVQAQGAADFGLAFTGGKTPLALNLKFQATAGGGADVNDTDRLYIEEFANLLDNNTLTLDELRSSAFLEANEFGIPLGIAQPEEVLTSQGSAGVLLRSQLAISLAATYPIKGKLVDFGITPKFSTLTASNLFIDVVDELNDNTDSLNDQLNDTEVEESTFTFDVGASLALDNFQHPVRVAVVLRNAMEESIQTRDGFSFETTPQLIIGGALTMDRFTITGDLALNEAKVDNFESQKMAVGVEIGSDKFSLRGGISHDASRGDDSTALSIGVGLGPLQIGTRLTSSKARDGSVQLSYSF